MVKDFGIDPKTLSKPEDLRKFFHVESGKFAEQLVFEGEFICFVLEKHILDK